MLLVAVAVSIAGAFAYLGRSSFWLDELYTVYRSQGSYREVLLKVLRLDVAPPLYYWLAKTWSLLFGVSETALRSLSAAAAAGTAVALYFSGRRVLSIWASLLLVAMCVTSFFWFDKSQEARPYALALLGSALLLGGLVRAATANADPRSSRQAAAWIIASAFPFSFVHFYVFLISGIVILEAIMLVGDRRARLLLFACGSALLALMAAYLIVRSTLSSLASPLHDSWLSHEWLRTFTYVSLIKNTAGTVWGAAVVLLTGIAAFAAWCRKRTSLLAEIGARPVLRAAAAASAVPVIILIVVVGLAFAGYPMICERYLGLTLPFAWFAVAAVADWSSSEQPTLRQAAQKLACALLMVLAAAIVLQRPLPHRTEWRGSAAAIAARPGCATTTVLIATPNNPPNAPEVFPGQYAFYAPKQPTKQVFLNQTGNSVEESAFPVLVARAHDIVTGHQTCPVVLWSAWTNVKAAPQLRDRLAQALGPDGARLRIELFPHWRISGWKRPTNSLTDIFLITVIPRRPAVADRDIDRRARQSHR